MSTTPLSLVAFKASELEARASRIDALVVDRARYQGGAGAAIERRFLPLAPDEQACKDRCAEKVRAAKHDTSLSPYEVRRRLITGDPDAR